jgi:hypothetical protein
LREQFIELKKNMAEYIESCKVKRERGWGDIWQYSYLQKRGADSNRASNLL